MTTFGRSSINASRPAWLVPAGGLLILLSAVVAVILMRINHEALRRPIRHEELQPRLVPPLPLPEQNVIKPLSPTEALVLNASVPLSKEPLEAARPFTLGSGVDGALARTAATDCLTAAVYYEAAADGEAGERAVAQVVLNRVRHPAFPSTVCGVVYQGSDRPSGCQFTFACDGSLSRKPSERGWATARRIAAEALDGKVDGTVGMATHYHANYVVPYWASDLSKITVVGTQIFYRWNGYWGRRAAFRQSYTGEASFQNELAANIAVDVHPVEPSDQLSAPGTPSPIADMTAGKLAADTLSSPNASLLLRADEKAGTLKVNEGSRVLPAPNLGTRAEETTRPSGEQVSSAKNSVAQPL